MKKKSGAAKKLRVWKTLDHKVILNHSRYLVVENHRIQLPDGEIIEDWPWVIIPDAAIVFAVNEANEFVCFR